MGRHSAPDDHEEDAVASSPVATDRHPDRHRGGRHAHADESGAQAFAEDLTAPLPAVRPDPIAEPADPEAEGTSASSAGSPGPSPAPSKHVHSTAADLALLRERSDVRARVIAAVIVPFLLYTAVLVAIGAMDVYPIWVWIPLVTAGVVAGSILDAAHRRRGAGTE